LDTADAGRVSRRQESSNVDSKLILVLERSRPEAANSLTFWSELAAGGHRTTTALPMTMTGNHLLHHQQTFGLQ
jgi:hypothetical protein